MSLHFIEREQEPAIDQMIAAQAMDNRVKSASASLKTVLSILNQRCVRCGQWLTDEARCLHCGEHQ